MALKKKKLTLGVFIDFSKAFDRINHISLLKKLDHYGFRGSPLDLLRSYLMHRKQCVCISGEYSDPLNLEAGVPQGSILGPILFSIYINDLANISNLPRYIIYADDTSLFFQSSSADHLAQEANTVLATLYL